MTAAAAGRQAREANKTPRLLQHSARTFPTHQAKKLAATGRQTGRQAGKHNSAAALTMNMPHTRAVRTRGGTATSCSLAPL